MSLKDDKDLSEGVKMSEGISRRSFLADAALMAGGATLAAGLSGCASSTNETASASDAASEIEVGTRPEAGGLAGPLPMQTGKIGPDAKPILPIDAPANWDAEYDVVVVGSGYGGLVAAAYAAENGYDVALLEKSDTTGGASRHAAINMVVPGGAQSQNEMGYAWPGDTFDVEAAAAQLEENFNFNIDIKLLKGAIEAGGPWADWMCAQSGVQWVCEGSSFVDVDIHDGKRNTVLGNDRTCDALETNARNAGADVKLQCECKALVQQDGRVIGVKCGGDDELYLRAKKGVILCAGGMGYNLDLLEQYVPTAYMYTVQGGPFPSHTGDAFRMGLGMGADVSGFNSYCAWEGGLDEYWGSGDGQFFHYFWNGAKQLIQNPWLLIDKAGNRLPYFLKSFTKGEILQERADFESFSMGDLPSAAAWMGSAGHRAYAIFDSNYKSSLTQFEPTLTCLDESRIVLKPDGKTVENDFCGTDWEGDFEKAVNRGAIQKADTLDELAEQLGLKPERLKAAVEDWNRICAQGYDDEMPCPYLKEWLVPLNNPPYYGAAEGGVIGKTLAGLRVNEKMQVVDDDVDAIPGLYAGWTTAGGICGESSFCTFGNPSLDGGVGMSGVGGWMAIKGLLASEE